MICWQEVDTALVRKEEEIDANPQQRTSGKSPVFESKHPKERLLGSFCVILFSTWNSVGLCLSWASNLLQVHLEERTAAYEQYVAQLKTLRLRGSVTAMAERVLVQIPGEVPEGFGAGNWQGSGKFGCRCFVKFQRVPMFLVV